MKLLYRMFVKYTAIFQELNLHITNMKFEYMSNLCIKKSSVVAELDALKVAHIDD